MTLINEHYINRRHYFSRHDRCRRDHRIHDGGYIQKVFRRKGIQEEAHRQSGKDQ